MKRKQHRCEATVENVRRCKHVATMRLNITGTHYWLCDRCAESWLGLR